MSASKPKIFVALDFANKQLALDFASQIQPINPYFKVGLELFVAEGPSLIHSLHEMGARIFLDLKFHDIPNTVAACVRRAVALNVGWLNVHCAGGIDMMRAAADAAQEEAFRQGTAKPTVLGVTILTSLSDKDVQDIGYPRSSSAQVKHFVDLALQSGLDGVVCSSQEIALVQSVAGSDFSTMVPGIRPIGDASGDQKRIMTPEEAARLGAHCLVIGRPITKAEDPQQKLKDILATL